MWNLFRRKTFECNKCGHILSNSFKRHNYEIEIGNRYSNRRQLDIVDLVKNMKTYVVCPDCCNYGLLVTSYGKPIQRIELVSNSTYLTLYKIAIKDVK